jgi:hypothetical protein
MPQRGGRGGAGRHGGLRRAGSGTMSKALGALLLGCMLLQLWSIAGESGTSPPGQHLPRSYYRFEDAAALMKDSAPAALDLQPKGAAVPIAKTQAEGGQVGGWMQLDGCGSNWNRSLWANASQLPRQCLGPTTATGAPKYCNPNFACVGMPGGKKGGCCCNNTADPQGKISGMTIEFLIKLGRCAKVGVFTSYQNFDLESFP